MESKEGDKSIKVERFNRGQVEKRSLQPLFSVSPKKDEGSQGKIPLLYLLGHAYKSINENCYNNITKSTRQDSGTLIFIILQVLEDIRTTAMKARSRVYIS